jgi:secondary thiamine-phosphate synthase enzyme
VIAFREFHAATTGRFDAVDITDAVHETVKGSGVDEGTALIFAPHTTCCISLAAEGEEVTREIEHLMGIVAPEDIYYAHDDLEIRTENLVDQEPPNARSHITYLFAGKPSESVVVSDGRLVLGEDQRIFLIELDSPRPRRYCVQVLGR